MGQLSSMLTSMSTQQHRVEIAEAVGRLQRLAAEEDTTDGEEKMDRA